MYIYTTCIGTTNHDCETFLTNWDNSERAREERKRKYCMKNTLKNFDTVGTLVVKVYRAKGLHAADLGGSSDPFSVLELGMVQKVEAILMNIYENTLIWTQLGTQLNSLSVIFL